VFDFSESVFGDFADISSAGFFFADSLSELLVGGVMVLSLDSFREVSFAVFSHSLLAFLALSSASFFHDFLDSLSNMVRALAVNSLCFFLCMVEVERSIIEIASDNVNASLISSCANLLQKGFDFVDLDSSVLCNALEELLAMLFNLLSANFVFTADISNDSVGSLLCDLVEVLFDDLLHSNFVVMLDTMMFSVMFSVVFLVVLFVVLLVMFTMVFFVVFLVVFSMVFFVALLVMFTVVLFVVFFVVLLVVFSMVFLVVFTVMFLVVLSMVFLVVFSMMFLVMFSMMFITVLVVFATMFFFVLFLHPL
jgi:hypothetical protein